MTTRKLVGIFILCFWIPVVFAFAFPDIEEGMYTIAGFMMFIFGTWGGILLITGDK